VRLTLVQFNVAHAAARAHQGRRHMSHGLLFRLTTLPLASPTLSLFAQSRSVQIKAAQQPVPVFLSELPSLLPSEKVAFKSTRADHFKSAPRTRSGLAMAHGPARQRTLPANPTDMRHMAGVARHAGRVSERAGLLPLARSGASLRQTPTHPTRIDVTSIASRAAAGNRLFPARSRRIWLIY
jgi:hypothetical protein